MQEPKIVIHKRGDWGMSVSVEFFTEHSPAGDDDPQESSAVYWIHVINDEDNDSVEIEIEDEQQFDGEKSVYQNVLPESRLA
jgi:hypothetical protein